MVGVVPEVVIVTSVAELGITVNLHAAFPAPDGAEGNAI